jgi:hypothetical protein
LTEEVDVERDEEVMRARWAVLRKLRDLLAQRPALVRGDLRALEDEITQLARRYGP